MIEQLAVLVYGVLTLIIAVSIASMQHSVFGMLLAFAAAGMTYLLQAEQMKDSFKPVVFDVGTWIVIALTMASVAVSILSGV